MTSAPRIFVVLVRLIIWDPHACVETGTLNGKVYIGRGRSNDLTGTLAPHFQGPITAGGASQRWGEKFALGVRTPGQLVCPLAVPYSSPTSPFRFVQRLD